MHLYAIRRKNGRKADSKMQGPIEPQLTSGQASRKAKLKWSFEEEEERMNMRMKMEIFVPGPSMVLHSSCSVCVKTVNQVRQQQAAAGAKIEHSNEASAAARIGSHF